MCYMVAAYAAMAIAAAMSATAQVQSSQATASNLKYNAKMAEKNAQTQETLIRNRSRKAIATQTVALGGQNTRVSEGSALDLLSESAKNAELDAMAVRYSGESQANSLRAQASGTLTGGLMGAGAEIMGGLGKLFSLGAGGGGGAAASSARGSMGSMSNYAGSAGSSSLAAYGFSN